LYTSQSRCLGGIGKASLFISYTLAIQSGLQKEIKNNHKIKARKIKTIIKDIKRAI